MQQDAASIGKPVRYQVGGVLHDRPFRIQRLGHFGFNVDDVEACCSFYGSLLGLRITDVLDLAPRIADPAKLAALKQTKAIFFNHGTDHHSFALFPQPVLDVLTGGPAPAEMKVNQISWQVGSLQEVRDALDWLQAQGSNIHRIGRDMPGSNWHSYPYDAEGHVNELYYGMEQIGWNLRSKPRAMYDRGFKTRPELPQVSEYEEVRLSESSGIDLASGHRIHEQWPLDHNVGGVLLARPFKITKIGPVRLFVKDIEKEVDCYTRLFGLRISEEVTWHGQRCVFLRANTEHHSLALYPQALRAELGLSTASSCLSIGLRLGSYEQLRNAVSFLQGRGVIIRQLPPELLPGMDYTAFAVDPQGHLVQLYAYMESIGWNGKARPADRRRKAGKLAEWPAAVEAQPDEGDGEIFLGPLG